ncbi:MAG: acyl-ACP--UDP-N-acetylglucosamine O-acyltransferase [Verrucomicrobiota bacterium]|nr:acyl-ACP--UDP-N-acetylglucosamine O-acyltransferase [Verrucomicrobiota bacterium]
MKIHSSAIISPDAELADDVEIGPFVCIEGPATIASGCIVQAHAVLSGTVRLGKNNTIGYGAIIGAPPQDFGFRPETRSEVVIGERNTIREYCTIHRGTTEGSATRVGDDNFLMAGAHLAHNVSLGNNVIIANNSLLGGHVEVQDRVFIGGGSVFHQHMRVGTLAITQGLSGFSKDIPPYCIGAEINYVAGLNVVGLRRAKFSAEQRREIKEAFALFYNSGLNASQAIEKAHARKWNDTASIFFDFITAAKKRGVCALLRTKSASLGEDEP